MVRKDTRTAHEKWEAAMGEANWRGYWYILDRPLPIELVQGWHRNSITRPCERTTIEIPPKTRRPVPPGCRDETPDVLEFKVTTYAPLNPRNANLEPIGERRRTLLGLPSCIFGRRPASDNRQAMSTGVAKVYDVGPRWEEWCAWQDQYIRSMFKDLGRGYHGIQRSWHRIRDEDLKYAKVLQLLVPESSVDGSTASTNPAERKALILQSRSRFFSYLDQLSMRPHRTLLQSFSESKDVREGYFLLPRTWNMVQHGIFYCTVHGRQFDENCSGLCQKTEHILSSSAEVPIKWLEELHDHLESRRRQMGETVKYRWNAAYPSRSFVPRFNNEVPSISTSVSE